MAQIGVLTSFDHNLQTWTVYKARLQQWFIANDIDNVKDASGTKRRAILLSALSDATYKLAADLALPKNLQTVPFEDICSLLDNHFTPKTCGFSERYKFYSAVQNDGESYPQWAARLRGLTAQCGLCGFLSVEEALRDHFVMGMLPGSEREKLFAQNPADLTLSKAVELAESARCARAGATAGAGQAPRPDQLFKIASKNQQSAKVLCSVCGYNNHTSEKCRFANYRCKKCHVKGHLRRMCKKLNYMEEEGENGDDGEDSNRFRYSNDNQSVHVPAVLVPSSSSCSDASVPPTRTSPAAPATPPAPPAPAAPAAPASQALTASEGEEEHVPDEPDRVARVTSEQNIPTETEEFYEASETNDGSPQEATPPSETHRGGLSGMLLRPIPKQSEWSVEWSTSNIPGMDNAAGSARQRRVRGRRRLRFAALALASCLTMHCRVVEPAVTTGLLYYPFLIAAVAGLANPLRHFEVYLGQWSINGPGRAFRLLPMLDGIGIAMCISSLVRAINCCTMAAMALLYVVYSSSDSRLPSTYCRDWNLKAYEPVTHNISFTAMNSRRQQPRLNPEVAMKFKKFSANDEMCGSSAVLKSRSCGEVLRSSEKSQIVRQCNEVYLGYPVIYSSPAYNYFYVELVRLRPSYDFGTFNVPLLICLACIWVSIWLLMIAERITFGRLVWNSLYPWIAYVPWIWVACLAVVAIPTVTAPTTIIKQWFKLGDRDIFMGLTDAFVVALYIHSASMGTELVHGKGLNFYALGHIDPLLNHDNVWHSCLVLALAVLHSFCTTICALGDVTRSEFAGYYNTRESFMWVMPMYSKCTSRGNYSHAMSCIIFGGLSFSYIVVAYPLIKSSLHTIFEYKVKLVFVEQQIVAVLICSCMLLSLPYATAGGLALLESVESMMTGLAMPLVVLAELVAMLYVYRSPDFQSDINIATEDNACNTRISTSWHIIPLITVVVLIGKIISVSNAEMPARAMYAAVAPLLVVVLALPLRAAHNAVVFMHPAPRRGV